MKTTIDESQIKVLIDLAKQATAKKIIFIIESQPWDGLNVPDYEETILAAIREKFGLEI